MVIKTLLASQIKNFGIGHACQSIVSGMALAGGEVSLRCVGLDRKVVKGFEQTVLPRQIMPFAYRYLSDRWLKEKCFSGFIKSLKHDDVAYMWPGFDSKASSRAHTRGAISVIERINTHQLSANELLSEELQKLGFRNRKAISRQKIEAEISELESADAVFCPSPLVAKSLTDNGVHPRKLLVTSYGFCEDYEQLSLYQGVISSIRRDHIRRRPRFIFVGRVGVRKGAHHLLEYWRRAQPNAELLVVGRIENNFEALAGRLFEHPDISHMPFTSALEQVYADADVFILPSVEEGSPLVTYQALASGLPVVASPMGSGGIVADGQNGFVIDVDAYDTWVDRIRLLAKDEGVRLALSQGAIESSSLYTWDRVGASRYALLNEFLGR